MKVVGVTACPSGVAHTYMAAEALSLAGKKAGIEVKVETQGSAGIENELTAEEIKEAGGVVFWVDADPEIRYQRVSVGSRGRTTTDNISFAIGINAVNLLRLKSSFPIAPSNCSVMAEVNAPHLAN